jgi:hypothetical protein
LNRSFDRGAADLRPVRLQRKYTRHAEGSVLVEIGHTQVLCTASVEEKVPPFLKGKGQGWVTAEYGMLPRATNTRGRREAAEGKQSGRTQEIQRLIGRSLRAVTNVAALGERQVTIDCDVLQADGGHAVRLDHRGHGGDGGRLRVDARAGNARRGPDPRLRGRGVRGHRRRHAGPRPRLRRGLGLRHGHERGDDGRRPLRRGAGHGRGPSLHARGDVEALDLASKGIAELVAAQRSALAQGG